MTDNGKLATEQRNAATILALEQARGSAYI